MVLHLYNSVADLTDKMFDANPFLLHPSKMHLKYYTKWQNCARQILICLFIVHVISQLQLLCSDNMYSMYEIKLSWFRQGVIT